MQDYPQKDQLQDEPAQEAELPADTAEMQAAEPEAQQATEPEAQEQSTYTPRSLGFRIFALVLAALVIVGLILYYFNIFTAGK